MVSINLGFGHVLALTDQGEVYGWGKNEYKQVCDSPDAFIQQPKLIEAIKSHRSIGICCGPMQSFVWTDRDVSVPKTRVPFIIDLNEYTLR